MRVMGKSDNTMAGVDSDIDKNPCEWFYSYFAVG